MLDLVLHLVIAFGFGPSRPDVDALRRTAPEPISFEVATDHLLAARLAGASRGLDADLLLSIAAHESRYDATAETPEVGGRVSCGSMTPTPVARCSRAGVLAGYLSGADHLAGWLRAAHEDLRVALLGYAGGYALIRACAEGPVLRDRRNGQIDLCGTSEVFLRRARWIRRELARGPSS